MWTLSVGTSGPSGAPTRELTTARSRRFTFKVDAPCEAQFSIDGRHDETLSFESLASDVWCWRDGDLMLRGRMGAEQDAITADVHTATIQIVDYRGMLHYRRVVDSTGGQGAVFASTDQAVLCWDLIAWSQAQDGGDWGVTDGVGDTSGVNRVRTIEPGKSIGEEIGLIGRLENGFEWEIDALLAFNRWYPQRGTDRGVVLDYGGRVVSLQRQQNPTEFGNSVLVTGADGLTPKVADGSGIASDPRGRWEITESFPTIINQPVLDARGPSLLAETEVLRAAWSATLKQGEWQGRDHIWLGDTVMLAVRSGRFNFAVAHRVMEVQVAVGDDGDETVTLALVEVG